MPATISNPRDLYLTLLADVLFVERTLSSDVLPDLLGKVGNPALAGALAAHLGQTKRHVVIVEGAFRAVGAQPSSNHSLPFVGLKDQHAELSSSVTAPPLADLLHATAAIHSEHHEIAAYEALVRLCGIVDVRESASALRGILEQEKAALLSIEHAHDELLQAARDHSGAAA